MTGVVMIMLAVRINERMSSSSAMPSRYSG